MFTGAAIAASAAGFAQGAGGSTSNDPQAVQAGTYKVDPGHTQVLFSVSHMGFSIYSGLFSQISGKLQIDPRHIDATRLDVTVPVSSVSTTSDKLDGELKSQSWLDAAQFHDMSYHSDRVIPTGPGRADISGELTLHGVTRPVTLKARFVGAGLNPLDKAYTVGFEAEATIDRSAFGVKTYVPTIGDQVTLRIAGAFEKAG